MRRLLIAVLSVALALAGGCATTSTTGSTSTGQSRGSTGGGY